MRPHDAAASAMRPARSARLARAARMPRVTGEPSGPGGSAASWLSASASRPLAIAALTRPPRASRRGGRQVGQAQRAHERVQGWAGLAQARQRQALLDQGGTEIRHGAEELVGVAHDLGAAPAALEELDEAPADHEMARILLQVALVAANGGVGVAAPRVALREVEHGVGAPPAERVGHQALAHGGAEPGLELR